MDFACPLNPTFLYLKFYGCHHACDVELDRQSDESASLHPWVRLSTVRYLAFAIRLVRFFLVTGSRQGRRSNNSERKKEKSSSSSTSRVVVVVVVVVVVSSRSSSSSSRVGVVV